MNPAVLAAVCAAGFAGALVMIVAGVRGRTDGTPFRAGRSKVTATRRLPRWSGSWLRLLGAAGLGIGLWVLSGWPVAGLLAFGIVVGIPYFFGAGRVAKSKIDRLEALEEWTRRLADSIGTGVDPVQAIVRSAQHAPRPIAAEVVTLANALSTPRLDRSVALRAFAAQIDDALGDTVAMSLEIAVSAEASARVPEVLRLLAVGVAEDVKARRQIEAMRAGPRREARSIVIVEILFIVGVTLFTDYTAPYGSVLGQLVLAIVAATILLALFLLRRFSLSPEPPRVLTGGVQP